METKIRRISLGLSITAVIFLTATLASAKLDLGSKAVPNFCITLFIELGLSLLAILLLRNIMTIRIALPQFKTIVKPILLGIATTVLINATMTLVTKLAGEKIEIPTALAKLQPWQVICFVFVLASVAEEMLFRGLLLNLLKPLQNKSYSIFKRRLSLPVIISAIAFGAAHLVLLTTDASALFLVRIVLFTTCLGIIAGYYQEKYNNHSYAIIVHMSGNFLAIIASFSLQQ
jgi:membrane protease YdiL (CAAX protease family)